MTESGKEKSPEAAVEVEEKGGRLQQKLDHLEEYWDSRKAELEARKTTVTPEKSPSLSSSSSSSSSGKNRRALSMVENSPSSLMASLQLGIGSSLAGRWKVRTNDLAVEEVLMERRAAIVDGRLKGRRLFHDDQPEREDDVSVDGGWGFADIVYCYDSDPDIGGYQDEQKGQGEGVSPYSCSSSSFVCDECLEKAVMDAERKDREDTNATLALMSAKYVNPDKIRSPTAIAVSVSESEGRRWRWTVLMLCLAIGFVVVAGLLFMDAYSDQVRVPT